MNQLRARQILRRAGDFFAAREEHCGAGRLGVAPRAVRGAARTWRWLAIASLILGTAAGCASLRKKNDELAHESPLTPQEQKWWEENRGRAKYIPGRGYYVEGTSGFFDEYGRPQAYDPTSVEGVEEQKNTMLSSLSPENVSKNFKKLIGKAPDEGLARAAFSEGETLFRQAQYREAAKKFKVAAGRWPDSPLEEEALFMAAESRFFADHYLKADDVYGELLKKYSGTRRLDDITARRFAIARYWDQYDLTRQPFFLQPNLIDRTRPVFDASGHALRISEGIREHDSTGPLADDSVMAMANLHFRKGRYADADHHYQTLRTDYPKSEHQYLAHLLGLRTKLLIYQGPEYDGVPLAEADRLASQLLNQFHGELSRDDRERMIRAKAEIQAQLALRDWQRAEFYEKGEYHRAARFYYENVARNYPETKLATEALARIEAGRDKPDEPTPNFAWLVNLFPESQKAGASMAQAPAAMRR